MNEKGGFSPLGRLRVALGTAQLGMKYGIANREDGPTTSTAHDVLDEAWRQGITMLDTARLYGKAEERIGSWIRASGNTPFIISKLPRLTGEDRLAFIRESFAASVNALGVDRLDGYLVHRASDLDEAGVADVLRELVANGQIQAFGVSVYGPEQVEAALRIRDLSLLQCPISLFDQRIRNSGLLEECRKRNITVFARSVFLQGALLMDPAALPAFLAPLAKPLWAIRTIAASQHRSVADIAMLCVRNLDGVSCLVLGADTPAQVAEIGATTRHPSLPSDVQHELWSVGQSIPLELTDISGWPQKGT
jgi:aryl-alcohol dehydrogenase-like predicted oxidoreductase